MLYPSSFWLACVITEVVPSPLSTTFQLSATAPSAAERLRPVVEPTEAFRAFTASSADAYLSFWLPERTACVLLLLLAVMLMTCSSAVLMRKVPPEPSSVLLEIFAPSLSVSVDVPLSVVEVVVTSPLTSTLTESDAVRFPSVPSHLLITQEPESLKTILLPSPVTSYLPEEAVASPSPPKVTVDVPSVREAIIVPVILAVLLTVKLTAEILLPFASDSVRLLLSTLMLPLRLSTSALISTVVLRSKLLFPSPLLPTLISPVISSVPALTLKVSCLPALGIVP